MQQDQAAVEPTPAADHVHYERRRPEETTLYQLVQENAETFFAQVEAETGAGLPDFVKAEFDAFLDCGILANGFVRVRCEDCADEKLVAFSCYLQRETIKSPQLRVRYSWDSPKDSLLIVSDRKARL